jgi:transcriptional regulator GlxA family with amidase domain
VYCPREQLTSGPLAAFDVPRHEVRPTPYRLTAYSEAGGEVVSSSGVCVSTSALERARLDTLIVVGGRGAIAASETASLVALVKKLARRTRRVASVCSGTFLLAEAAGTRQFTRLFVRETGETPAKAVRRIGRSSARVGEA